MADTTGEQDIRKENYEAMVKGFALAEFKMKQLVMESPSSAWIESYYRETATELTGGTGSAVKGVPRLAAFPYGEVSWTKVSAYIEKYGMEGVVSWEDATTDAIDVVARTLLRIGRAVAYAVDSQIYSVLSGAAGNTVAITVGYEWNAATVANRDPITNILQALREIQIDNFDTSNAVLCVSPTDYANLISNSKVLNSPNFKFIAGGQRGVLAELCGCRILVSNVVTADQALLVIPKECGTWKSVSGLVAFVIPDQGVKYTIRAYEMGVCQATTPNAICTINNTQA